MKLFLTSRGLSTPKLKRVFISKLPKKTEGCSLLLISTVQSKDEEVWGKRAKSEIEKIGIKNITVYHLYKEKFTFSKKKFDIVYLLGGATFSVLKEIRKKGADKFIRKSVLKNRSIFLGISAGSIIAGPNIESAGWGSEADENEVGLKDLTGLKLTNVAIFPHYEGKMKKEITGFQKQVKYKIITVKDGEMVFMDGKKIVKID